MTTYSHNSLNQITAIGGTAGPMPVIVRGDRGGPDREDAWRRDASTTDWRETRQPPAVDADGNMTSDGVRGYEWNFASQLTKVTWGGSPVKSTEYRYNALGQRSERIEKSGATETAHYYYLYQGIRLVCRYQGGTAATNIDRQYLSQGEQRKISSAWSSYYYNRDHLGSIREVMNADGTLAARYDYTPYGVRRVQYESTAYPGGCDLGFTGHITQPSPVSGQTELVLTHFRGYDPELGRWLSADPIGEVGGLNLYGYVGNDPLSFWDEFGLCPGAGGKFNFSKAIVSTGNAMNAARLAALGMTKIVIGTGGELTGVGAAPGAAVVGMGVWNLNGSKAAMKRSFKQWGEAWNDNKHWDKKNFWGLAPFGDKIDDECEPRVGDLARGLGRNLAGDPIGFVKDVASKTSLRQWLEEIATWGF